MPPRESRELGLGRNAAPDRLEQVLRIGLPPITEHYAEGLLATIWRGVAPEP